MKNKVTIKHIADHANVSTSTVSRYLNRSSYIIKEKVDAIEQAIFELGFEHRERKNHTTDKRSMNIGIMAPSYDSPHITRVLTGMNRAIMNSSYQLKVEISMWDKDREARVLAQFILQKVDAIIVVGGYLSDKEIRKITKKTPVLLFGSPVFTQSRSPSGLLPQLMIDNELGGYLATNHLIQLGHKKILHLHGPLENVDAIERIHGYKRALHTAGIECDDKLLISGDFETVSGYHAITQALEKDIEFSAIFAANDESAIGAIQALYQKGLRTPEDISIVGFDDLPMSTFIVPPLTTINQPFEEMGEISIHYALDLISGNKANYQIPPMNLIQRDSAIPLK